MYSCIFKNHDRVVIEIDDEELLEKFMGDIEDLIKSTIFHKDYASAKDYIEMLLKLKKYYIEILEEKVEVIEDV